MAASDFEELVKKYGSIVVRFAAKWIAAGLVFLVALLAGLDKLENNVDDATDAFKDTTKAFRDVQDDVKAAKNVEKDILDTLEKLLQETRDDGVHQRR